MKHIHTEGPGSILKSRFARGVLPLVAALFACALAAPEARAAYTTSVPSDLVNLTGTGTASTTGNIYNNEGPATAFDGKTGATRVIWNQKTNIDLVYEFPSPTRVNAFRIWRSSQYERHPKTFRFEGLDDAGEWQKLDGDENLDKDTDWKPVSYRYYQFANPEHFTKYRLFIEANCGNQYTEFFELEMFCVDDGTPTIASHSITANSATSFNVSVTMGDHAATAVNLNAVDPSESIAAVVGLGAVAANTSAIGTLQDLPAGATYQVRVDTTDGTLADKNPVDTLYTGAFTLSDVVNAQEAGCVPGSVTVSREASDPYPLTVNYSFASSDAVEGQTYAVPTGYVVIPADARSAVIEVTPLVDMSVQSDTTITVSLAAGNYKLNGNETTSITIVNAVIPSDKNVWVAGASSDGLASTASNWSKGKPSASDPATLEILVSGDYSSADMEWNPTAENGLATTVASWTQTANYAGTVMFDTEFSDYSGATFTLFTVTGNCDLQGGAWSCRGNYNNFGVVVSMMQTTKTDKHWCLNVSVGGSMTVGSGSAINVTGRGYGYQTPNPNYSQSYGGYAFGGANSPYGSITEPFDPGMGCISQTDGNNKSKISGIGGGAVKLAVSGNLVVDGRIEAVGTMDKNIVRSGGTGGSIWIDANQISGSGTIDASACPKSFYTSDQGVSIGSGGRIALYTLSPLAFPISNVFCSGTSYAGTGSTSKTRISGPGTIFVKDPTQTHGTLYVKQSRDVATSGNKWTGTPVMGDLSLDAVVLSGNAQLRIPVGTSLALPSLSAVTTDNTIAGIAGVVCDGGTLNIGNGDQVLKSNVAFASPTPFAFLADLTLESGAHLGRVGGTFGQEFSHFDTNFTVSVAGNLTIPSGATAGASGCCAFTATDNAQLAAHGGQSLWASLGGYGTNAFDSVLNPSMPGGSRYRGFRAGGVFRLTVGGELALNGTISSDGSGARGNADTTDNQAAPAGGTLNLSLGSLSGTGSITAQGGCGKFNYAGGAGGGRVAVRLTGNGSTFSDYWKTNITAYGVSFSGNNNGKASSAGTVYLQDASDGEAAGMVLIRNDLALEAGAVNNKAVTLYPGKGVGCDAPEAFKKTDLAVAGAAKVQLTDALKIAGLTIDSDSLIDLNGKTLTVKSAKINGVRLAPGTYDVESDVAIGEGTLGDYLDDTAEDAGGELVVKGVSFMVIVR